MERQGRGARGIGLGVTAPKPAFSRKPGWSRSLAKRGNSSPGGEEGQAHRSVQGRGRLVPGALRPGRVEPSPPLDAVTRGPLFNHN